jgi:type I site-specific restriction endonuclease
MKNEAYARIKINNLLEEAGWRFFDSKEGSANILLENYVKITQTNIDAWGNDFEEIKGGSLDFLLVDSNNKPICVLEAKKEGKHPLTAKEQAREIQDFTKPVIEESYKNFLLESSDPDLREFSDPLDQIREIFIHQNFFSIEDIKFCIDYAIEELSGELAFEEIKTLHEELLSQYAEEV